MDPIEKLARRIRGVERLAFKAATQPQLAYSSIEDGAIQSVEDGTLKAIIGKQYDGTQAVTVLNGPTPPTPSAPGAVAALEGAILSWDGLFADGSVSPMDFTRVELHASTDPAFTAEFADTLKATFETPRGGEVYISLPIAEHYVRLVTRTATGKRSVASVATSVTPQALADSIPAVGSDGSAPTASPAPLVTPGIGTLFVSWAPVANADPTTYDVHASTVSGFTPDATTLLGDSQIGQFVIKALHDGGPLSYAAPTYVRLVAKDTDGSAPPSAEVAATPIKITGTDVAVGAITTVQISDDAITAAKIADQAVGTTQIALDAITSDLVAAGAIGSVEISDGAILAAKIADGAVATAKIALDAITNDLIAAGAVTSVELATDAVTAAKIAAGAVTTAKVATDAITSDLIAANAVTATEIATDAVTAPKILAGAVTAGKIAADAVTANEIAAGSVTASELAAGAVTAGKIAADAVTANEIAAGSVTASEIATDAVTAVKILAGAVTAGKIAADAVTANEIAAGSVTASELAAGAVTAGKIAADAVTANEIAANAVTATEIATDAVTAGKILAGAVTAGKIAADAVTANEIAAGAITASELAAGAVVAGKIAADAVTANEIAANSVTASELAANAVTAAKILAGAVTAGKIDVGVITALELAAGAVTTDKLQANAVSADKLAANIVLGTTIATGVSGADRVVLDATGIQVLKADNSQRAVLPTNPTQPVFIKGTAELDSAVINDKLTLRGTNNAVAPGTTLQLQGAVQDPTSQVSVTTDWETVQTWMDPTQYCYAIRGLDFDNGGYHYANLFFGTQIMAYNEAGNFAGNVGLPDLPPAVGSNYSGTYQAYGGVVRVGGYYYTLGTIHRISDNKNVWQIRKWTIDFIGTAYTFVGFADVGVDTVDFNGSGTYPVLGKGTATGLGMGWWAGVSGGYVLYSADIDTSSLALVVGSGTSHGATVAAGNIGDVLYFEQGNFDFGSARTVYAHKQAGGQVIRSFSGTTQIVEDTFSLPAGTVGVCYNPTANNSFRSLQVSGNHAFNVKHSLMNWITGGDSTTANWWSTFTYRNTSSGYETAQSVGKLFTMEKRKRLTITAPAIPPGGTANDPNAVRLWVGTGATQPARTSMWTFATPAVGVLTATQNNQVFGSPNTNPPAANNFPASATSKLISSDGTRYLDSQGDALFRDISARSFASVASDSNGPLVKVNTDGSGRVGPMTWTAARAAKMDFDWVYPALSSGWINAGGTWETTGYCRRNGIVYLKGVLINGTNGQAPFFLPAGCLPLANKAFINVNTGSGGARTQVRSDGAIFVDSGNATTGWFLSGISFPAEA